ncbi:hypothetical protein LTR97_006060 [Elasticomyces elasticus]|uniref:Uncharacterized protein n=1 Tax=Elasticomyces elasticus TaxID=574655 RepID=A0AAN7W621_9PEZI|nr:hypothetical protein LTR97_006060 [Elasticomyces elasticus]
MKSFIALYLVLIAIVSTAIAALPTCYVNRQGVADCSSTPKGPGPSKLQLLMNLAGPRLAPWVQHTTDQYADVRKQAQIWQHQAQQNIDKFRSYIPSVNLTSANEWINTAAANVQTAIENQETTEFGKWLKFAGEETGLDTLLASLQAVKLEDLPRETRDHIRKNPKDTAYYVIQGVVFFTPGAVYGPLLKVSGFGRLGHRAHTLATAFQKAYGGAVPAGSWLSRLTSAGMGGRGRITLDRMTRLGALTVGAVNKGWGRLRNATSQHPEQ